MAISMTSMSTSSGSRCLTRSGSRQCLTSARAHKMETKVRTCAVKSDYETNNRLFITIKWWVGHWGGGGGVVMLQSVRLSFFWRKIRESEQYDIDWLVTHAGHRDTVTGGIRSRSQIAFSFASMNLRISRFVCHT